MKGFNQIRKQCFTVDLDPRYKDSIRNFAYQWLKCDRSITLKCHMLFVHVPQFLERQKNKFPNKGLGFWAEQSIEHCHNKVDKEYEGYKRQLDDPSFGPKMFDCMVAHNERAYGDRRN